ncbi:tetratricopeptide repeat protein [Gracilimonas tropica]|uniref:tetratricopeptide repeat protein n=1 Tax=Gracilimonas tropica TaxID=454600 RepID=UPI00037D68CD|nr:hypothetical protein [Gracilimonas tropica]
MPLKLIFALITSTLAILNIQITALAQAYSSDPVIHNFNANTFVTIDEIFNEFKGLQKFEGKGENNKDEFANHLKLTRHIFGYALIAKNLDSLRQIPTEKKEAFDLSIDLLNLDAKFKEIVTNEVYLEVDGHQLWIPIQDKLFSIWRDNVAGQDSVLIYTRIIGGYNTDPANSWFLIMTGFHEELQTVLWNEGIEKFNAGLDKIGERYLSKLIDLYPNDAEAKASLAYHYTEKGFSNTGDQRQHYFNKANTLFLDAERLAPDYGFQYFQQAILRYHQNRFVDSWNLIEKARENGHTDIEEKFLNQLNSKLSFEEYQKIDQ